MNCFIAANEDEQRYPGIIRAQEIVRHYFRKSLIRPIALDYEARVITDVLLLDSKYQFPTLPQETEPVEVLDLEEAELFNQSRCVDLPSMRMTRSLASLFQYLSGVSDLLEWIDRYLGRADFVERNFYACYQVMSADDSASLRQAADMVYGLYQRDPEIFYWGAVMAVRCQGLYQAVSHIPRILAMSLSGPIPGSNAAKRMLKMRLFEIEEAQENYLLNSFNVDGHFTPDENEDWVE